MSSASLEAASENQLAKETGIVRLTSVQSRLALCFYLLTRSRINQCWTVFGIAARLALAVGLHRRSRTQHSEETVEMESRKRTFWAAYSLDCYLSAALGRPRAFHDDDIDQVISSRLWKGRKINVELTLCRTCLAISMIRISRKLECRQFPHDRKRS